MKQNLQGCVESCAHYKVGNTPSYKQLSEMKCISPCAVPTVANMA